MASMEYTPKTASINNDQYTQRVTRKTNSAIASTRAVQEIAKYKCKIVGLDDTAKQDAMAIMETDDKEDQEKKALDFLDKYPCEIMKANIGVGGWFQYVATTSSIQEVQYSELVAEASKQSSSKLSGLLKGYFGFADAQVGAARDEETKNGEGAINQINNDSREYTTTFDYKCEGPTVFNIQDLEKGLEDPLKWTTFPSIDGHHYYQRIDNIMRTQGEDDDYPKMIEAAKIVKNIIDNGPMFFIRKAVIPTDATWKNVFVIGKTGSGKSALGNVLIDRYEGEDAFEVSDALSSCTQEPSFKINAERKIRYIDTKGISDTRNPQDFVNTVRRTWQNGVNLSNLHCMILTLEYGGKLTGNEANLMKEACTELFSGEARRRAILVITKCSSAMLSSEAKQQAWIDEQLNDDSNEFQKVYNIIGEDRERIVFVDCRMPNEDLDCEAIKCKQHNIGMAEKVLSVIHKLSDEGMEIRFREIAETLEREQRSSAPDIARTNTLDEDIKECLKSLWELVKAHPVLSITGVIFCIAVGGVAASSIAAAEVGTVYAVAGGSITVGGSAAAGISILFSIDSKTDPTTSFVL